MYIIFKIYTNNYILYASVLWFIFYHIFLRKLNLFCVLWFIISVQLSSIDQLCLTLCESITSSWSLSIQSVMPSNHLILGRPLLLLTSLFSSIRVFSNESALHRRWQSIGASTSISVLPMNIQDWFPLRMTGLISLQSKGLSKVYSNTTV